MRIFMGKNANFYAFGRVVNSVQQQQAELPAGIVTSPKYLGMNSPSPDQAPYETYVKALPRHNELTISTISKEYPEARNLSAGIGRITLLVTDMGLVLRGGSMPKDWLSQSANDNFADIVRPLGLWLADGITANEPKGTVVTPSANDFEPLHGYVNGAQQFATAEVVSTNNQYTGLVISKHTLPPKAR